MRTDVERVDANPAGDAARASGSERDVGVGSAGETSHDADEPQGDDGVRGSRSRGGTPVLRQMAMVAGALYTSAGMLVAGSLLVAGDLHAHPGVAWAIAAAGFASGVAWFLVGRRIDVPAWVHIPSAAGGSLLVALLVVAGGETFAGIYGTLFIYVIAFSFYYMSPRVAAGQTVVAAGAYLAVLWQVQEPGWLAHWLIVIGAAVVGAGLIAALGHRTGELLEREQRTATELAELNRVRDAFLRMVAHDLRTPLSTIVMNAETIEAHLDDLSGAELREMIGRQIVQGRRLTRMVADLLDTERLRAGALRPQRRPVRVDELIRETVGLADTSDHDIELDLEPVDATVDPTLVERALDNLLDNAAKHTASGTEVTVRLHRTADGIVLAVDDRGPGIPEGDRQTIFDLFAHGSDTRSNTGLGLALVREIATAHGGSCYVEDRDGGGASFRLWLPDNDVDANA